MSSSQNSHPLAHTWVLWEIRPYSAQQSKYFKPICEFNTVEKFWECWSNIPKPSELFSDGNRKVTVGGLEIRSLGLFKKNILPMWEDKGNAEGFQLEASRNHNAEALDTQWENLVLAMVGEVLEEDDNICGARVVNQAKKGKNLPQYKVEVWLRRKDEKVAEELRQRLGEVLSDVPRPALKLTADEFKLEQRKG